MTEFFDNNEVFQILVICNHINEKDYVFQFRLSFFKDMNNSHEFLIIDFVITFDRVVLLEEVSNRAQNFNIIILKQNSF